MTYRQRTPTDSTGQAKAFFATAIAFASSLAPGCVTSAYGALAGTAHVSVIHGGNPLQHTFRRLRDEWREATEFVSSSTQLTSHPAYLQIIGLGSPAIQLILSELESEPDHWFTALEAVTGENPVPADALGDLRRMSDAWLAWGRANGYLMPV